MSDEKIEPGDITDRFRAYAQSVDPEPGRVRRVVLLVAAAIVLLGVIAVAVTMVLP